MVPGGARGGLSRAASPPFFSDRLGLPPPFIDPWPPCGRVQIINNSEDPSWFTAELDGRQGFIPANYVQMKPHECVGLPVAGPLGC